MLTTLEQQVDPVHTAVLIVDMQNDFCAKDGYLDRKYNIDVHQSETVADNIMALVNAARSAGATIVWIQAIYDLEYLSEAHLARVSQHSGGEVLCARYSWGADFYDKIKPAKEELVIEKHRYSAFHGTDLDQHLRNSGIKTIVVTGVATHVCVDSTLRDGFFTGYHVVMPEDCVGANDPVAQQATIRTVQNNFGYVSNARHLIELWDKSA